MSEFLQVLCHACRACTNLLTLEPGDEQCRQCELKRSRSSTAAAATANCDDDVDAPTARKRERLYAGPDATTRDSKNSPSPTTRPPQTPTTSTKTTASPTISALPHTSAITVRMQPSAPKAARTASTPKDAAVGATLKDPVVLPSTAAVATASNVSTSAKTSASKSEAKRRVQTPVIDAAASDAAGESFSSMLAANVDIKQRNTDTR